MKSFSSLKISLRSAVSLTLFIMKSFFFLKFSVVCLLCNPFPFRNLCWTWRTPLIFQPKHCWCSNKTIVWHATKPQYHVAGILFSSFLLSWPKWVWLPRFIKVHASKYSLSTSVSNGVSSDFHPAMCFFKHGVRIYKEWPWNLCRISNTGICRVSPCQVWS